MAVTTTAKGGNDRSYPFATMGGKGERQQIGGYYLTPAANGEPQGVWHGRALEQLGLAEGQEVDQDVFNKIYSGEHPVTGERLGRAPASHAKYEDHLARLMAAEPHATAERLEEIKREAATATRKSDLYVDVTNSWSKSISVLHASIRENELHARLSGDVAGATFWATQEARFARALQDADAAGMRYAQEHAGYTRTGSHTRVGSKTPGRYAPADLAIASFLQGTSRSGDPQQHEHNLVAMKVRTVEDGKWRALDTMALRSQLPGIQATTAAYTEAELTRLFGVEWVDRKDGKGREIKGISQQMMDTYSTRSHQIDQWKAEAAKSWEAEHGQPPTAAQMKWIMNSATLATREGKEPGEIKWDKYLREWDSKVGGALAAVASQVSNIDPQAKAPSGTQTPGATDGPEAPAPAAQQRAMRSALASVQEKSSTWTRQDLFREMGKALDTSGMTANEAVVLLSDLTGRALASEVGQVVTTDAPEYPALPGSLQRPDGASVYTRPGSERYSTAVQLTIEQRLINAAVREGSPALDKEAVARYMGATVATLEAQLHERAQDATATLESGLRLDQAAALFHVLTSTRTGEVLVGPGGSGKSHCAAFAAKMWEEMTGKPVIAVTPSQASRNVLTAMGMKAHNFADFLGHTKESRGSRGAIEIPEGTLIWIDEGSMMSTPDHLDILDHVSRSGGHAVISGDHQQLQAVESGGGMILLARENGYAQLSTPVRFSNEWERDASLMLRDGQTTVLNTYAEHGRIRGGTRQEVFDTVRQAYVAEYLRGEDTLVMAKSNDLCRELSMRIRDDLVHLGIVADDPGITLAEGNACSAGDLILNRTQNYHRVGPGVANGDTLRIDKIEDGKVHVSKMGDTAKDGTRTWGKSFEFPRQLVEKTFVLGYAVTMHSAQGRTVTTGHGVFTGSEDRADGYVALSRGRERNTAHVIEPVSTSEPQPGVVADPALEEYDRIEQERTGVTRELTEKEVKEKEARAQDGRDRASIAVMTDVFEREGVQESATATARHELATADHIRVLGTIIENETRPVKMERYSAMVREVIPAELQDHESQTVTWLYRTLRQAEASGLDAREVLTRAAASRNFDGVRDPYAALKARIEKDNGAMVPAPRTSFMDMVEKTGDPEIDAYLAEKARMMDDRVVRLGEHLADTQPVYAVRALGPVPEDPEERKEWETRAGAIEAYREYYDIRSETDAIGGEPVNSPEARKAWHTAFRAMGPRDGFDARSYSDGSLLKIRQTYITETKWAPRYVGAELQSVRVSKAEHEAKATRAEVEAKIARERGDNDAALRHEEAAKSSRFTLGILAGHEEKLQADQDVRKEWELSTQRPLQNALAADTEYRHRHPGTELEPLRSAEPAPLSADDRDALVPKSEDYEPPAWIEEATEKARTAREELEYRQNLRIPSEDREDEYVTAWPDEVTKERQAILQPPVPEVPAAPEITRLAEERNAQRTAQTQADHGGTETTPEDPEASA